MLKIHLQTYLKQLKKYEPTFSDKEVRDILIGGLIFNSFLGYSAEQDWLKQNPEYRKVGKMADELYAVDFLKIENNEIVDAIQLKSAKSKRNNGSNYVMRNISKNIKFYNKYGVETIYVYYEWEYKNNKFNFKYERDD